MATNFADLAWNAAGPIPRTYGARFADVVNVKDFGAKGDGVALDGAAIQACLDAAFGEPDPGVSGNSRYANKAVYFPAGTYLVEQQLFWNSVEGGSLEGAGQYQTILKYVGPNSQQPPGSSTTAILMLRTVMYSSIRGICFDVLDSNANVGVQMINWPGRSNDGTGNLWFDCAFIGGLDAWLTGWEGAGALGSEQIFMHCTFRDSQWAFRVIGANALDISAFGCRFVNCSTHGISGIVGSVNAVFGCTFENNGLDVIVKQQQCPVIVGGNTKSANFCAAGPAWIASVYHSGNGFFFDAMQPSGLDNHTGVVIEGCLSPSGSLRDDARGKIYLRGNTFGNPNFLASYGGAIGEQI